MQHSERHTLIDNFLAASGWAGAKRIVLAADASFRRYERIVGQGRQAVLMDAPPDKEDVRPFVRTAHHLLDAGLSAPKLLASDVTQGFLLLEDLGDDLYTRLLSRQPLQEEGLYLEAANVLAAIYHQAPKADYSDFPVYDAALLMRECRLFAEWFLPAVMGGEEAKKREKEYMTLWRELLDRLPSLRPVLVMRDYHADNLLWLPARVGIKCVGLLDFQDAVVGSPAYDMVSFLEDARRDVKPETVAKVIDRYLESTAIPRADFMAAYALLGAQRNCKIIGIFVRLALRDGKQHYLSYLPRVWAHLEHDLNHPLLAPLKVWMDKIVKPEWRNPVILSNPKMHATL